MTPRIPKHDYVALWHRLSRSGQDAIGVLVLELAFLRFVAADLQGDEPGEGVRYLTRAGQRAAKRKAGKSAEQLSTIVQDEFPDLFGSSEPGHPVGIDPPWASPIRFRIRRAATLQLVEVEAADAVTPSRNGDVTRNVTGAEAA